MKVTVNPELAKGWQFDEARRVIDRFGGRTPDRPVLFETGYGPSGLPHIGTFGEVVRTTFIRRALEQLTGWQTRLVCFSDDMDGLRKVPDNVPNGDSLTPHLGLPLTKIPDPFGKYDSFGAHNNAQLRSFLDGFGFSYEFVSSSAEYARGKFNEGLLRLLDKYDAVMEVMLPTLGAERQKTYSPILPLSPTSGRVLQVPIEIADKQRGLVRFTDEDGKQVESSVLDGGAKLQWKPDWGMRWAILQVDYEMSGKDLIPSAQLSAKICRILGGEPPCGFHYELFLDEAGGKISKSKGNGLSVEEWLRYAPASSLAWFMYGKPRAAKRLHFGVIPRTVEEWSDALAKWGAQDQATRLRSPLWSVYGGEDPPEAERPSIPYSLLLTLAGTVGDPTEPVLSGFVARHGGFSPDALRPMDKQLIRHALAYYKDFVAPQQKRRPPTPTEATALKDLADSLAELPPDGEAKTIQNLVYEVGKRHDFASLRDWFQACYEILFGQAEGPRLGSFFHLYGREESLALLRDALASNTNARNTEN